MADRYWVGGTASWDGTAGTKWATTSGGAGGASVPTSADDVFFTNLSTGTCTISTGNTGAKSINCTGFTGTIAGTAAITVSGSVTLVAGMTYTYTGTLTINAASTLTSGGKTHGSITFNASGSTLTLGDACTLGSANTFTLTAGTIALNGFTLTAGIFSSSNSNTRAITFGSQNIVLVGTTAGTTALAMATASNFTWTGTGAFARSMIGTATFQFGSTSGGFASNAPNISLIGGSATLTITSGSYFKNFSAPSGTNGSTLSGSAFFAGNVTLSNTGLTTAYTGFNPTFITSGTLTSAGRTLGNVAVNGVGATLTLADALTLGATNTFTLTLGTLNLNGNTLSTGIFSSDNSITRAITFGSANIALTSTTAATTILSMATATNFTWTGTGGFTRNMAATATVVFGTTGGATTNAPDLTVNAGASTLTITSGSYFREVNFTGSTSTVSGSYNSTRNLTLASGGTYTSLNPTFLGFNTVTSNGKTLGTVVANLSGATPVLTLADAMIASGFTLTQGTLNLANFTLTTAAFSSSNSNTRAISFGSADIVFVTGVGGTVLAMATATNFTWTGTGGFTRSMLVTTATFQFGSTSGGSVSNAPNLTLNAGGNNVTITSGSYFKNLNFTGSTSVVSGSVNMAGNLTLATGGFYTSVSPTFLASGTLTSVGRTLGNTTVNGSGITVTLADAMTSNNTLTLTQGTFDAANFNVTTLYFSSNNSNTRTLNMGTGTWTVSGGSAFTTWNAATSTNLIVNASTSTITMTNASTKTFAGGGKTYYNLNQGGAGALTISGSNTFNNITNSTQPATVTFTAGTTQTVSNFGLSGTAGNLITINSTTPGSQFTLSDASGTINAQYLAIQDSNATGGAVWNAVLSNGNVNAGNNLGWIFDTSSGNMFLMFM